MSGGPVTDYAAFAEAWAEVGPLVEARLRRRGTGREAAADIAQEVAVRALDRLAGGEGFDSRRGLLGWGHHVARNLGIDAWRKDRRTGEAVEVAAVDRGYDEVEWRLLLAATVGALTTLPPAQQTAVLALLAGSFPEDKREQVRDSTRRTRARARLRTVVGRFPGLWPVLRRWGRLLPAPVLTAGLWLTPGASPPTAVTTLGLPATTTTVSAWPSAPGVTFPVKPLVEMSHPRSSTPPAQPPAVRDVGAGHTPVVVVEHPAGELDVGTKPDEDRHFACVELGATSMCVDKLR